MTFGKWRQQLRLMQAMRLLAEGAKVTHAALEAGYSTPSAFISMFRKARRPGVGVCRRSSGGEPYRLRREPRREQRHPQSVYQMDTTGMRQLTADPQVLVPGQSLKLPDGQGTITFTGYVPWVSLAITHDPGQLPALICGLAALGGLLLSFMVRRRRVLSGFVRTARPVGYRVRCR